MKVVRLSAPRTGRLYPQEMFPVLIFTRGWVDHRAMVRSEGNMSLENPVTPPGIEPGTVRLVAQRLNYYATPGPRVIYLPTEISHRKREVTITPEFWKIKLKTLGRLSCNKRLGIAIWIRWVKWVTEYVVMFVCTYVNAVTNSVTVQLC
jgi:hypothetical protein